MLIAAGLTAVGWLVSVALAPETRNKSLSESSGIGAPGAATSGPTSVAGATTGDRRG